MVGTRKEEGSVTWEQSGGNWKGRVIEHREKWWELKMKKRIQNNMGKKGWELQDRRALEHGETWWKLEWKEV